MFESFSLAFSSTIQGLLVFWFFGIVFMSLLVDENVPQFLVVAVLSRCEYWLMYVVMMLIHFEFTCEFWFASIEVPLVAEEIQENDGVGVFYINFSNVDGSRNTIRSPSQFSLNKVKVPLAIGTSTRLDSSMNSEKLFARVSRLALFFHGGINDAEVSTNAPGLLPQTFDTIPLKNLPSLICLMGFEQTLWSFFAQVSEPPNIPWNYSKLHRWTKVIAPLIIPSDFATWTLCPHRDSLSKAICTILFPHKSSSFPPFERRASCLFTPPFTCWELFSLLWTLFFL